MRTITTNQAFTIVLKPYANPHHKNNRFEGDATRYVVEHAPRYSISIDDLHRSYLAMRKELIRVGKLKDPRLRQRRYEVSHKEMLAERKAKYHKEHPEQVRQSSKSYRQRQKEKRLVIEGKLAVLSSESRLT